LAHQGVGVAGFINQHGPDGQARQQVGG
jgi:hypothetical protein